MIEICICGHERKEHAKVAPSDDWAFVECSGCKLIGKFSYGYHSFQLDNLNTIEHLAKQKNLI